MSTDLEKFVERGHARRGGRVENYFCLLKRRQIYKNFAFVARFNRQVNDHELLFAALREMILKYPILGASVVTTDRDDLSIPVPENDYIKIMNTIKLQDVILEIPDDIKSMQSKEEQMAALNKIEWEYGNETTLWKVGFLDDHTLVYLSNHVCSDGISGKNFIQEIQEAFNTVTFTTDASGYLLNYVADFQTLPALPPPIDAVVSYDPNWGFYPRYFFNLFIIQTMCTTGAISHRDDAHTYKIVNISSEKFATLRKKLQSDGITVSPYLNSAWLQAYQEVVLHKTYFKLTDFSVPCDSRQFIDSGIDTDIYKFGSNTGGNHFFYTPINSHDTATVSWFNNFYKWSKEKRNFLYGLGMITSKFIAEHANLDKIIQDATVGVKRTGTVMSNIGLLTSASADSKYVVEDALFAKNSGGTQFSYALSVVTTETSGLNVVVTVAEGASNSEKFGELVAAFERNIYKFIQ